MLRHLPPTASPLPISTLTRSLGAGAAAGARFDDALRDYLSVRACFTASSGRTALHLLLKGLRAQAHTDRAEVVMPAYTCPSLAKVVLETGLIPRFVDISPATMAYDDAALAGAIGVQTLAVIVVHPFGIPHPIESAHRLARAASAVLIEDAAQSMGARADGRPVGVRGDFGLFSLGPGKPISAGGGGIVCTDDEAHAAMLAQVWAQLPPSSRMDSTVATMRLAAMSTAFHPRGWWLATRVGLHKVGDQETSWGFRLTGLTSAQAEVAAAQLARLDAINQQRRAHAQRLMAMLDAVDYAHVPLPHARDRQGDEAIEPCFLRLPVIVETEARRDQLFDRLWDAGIGVGKMYKQTLAEFFPRYAEAEYPGAHAVSRRLLTLPTHHYLRDEDFARISDVVK